MSWRGIVQRIILEAQRNPAVKKYANKIVEDFQKSPARKTLNDLAQKAKAAVAAPIPKHGTQQQQQQQQWQQSQSANTSSSSKGAGAGGTSSGPKISWFQRLRGKIPRSKEDWDYYKARAVPFIAANFMGIIIGFQVLQQLYHLAIQNYHEYLRLHNIPHSGSQGGGGGGGKIKAMTEPPSSQRQQSEKAQRKPPQSGAPSTPAQDDGFVTSTPFQSQSQAASQDNANDYNFGGTPTMGDESRLADDGNVPTKAEKKLKKAQQQQQQGYGQRFINQVIPQYESDNNSNNNNTEGMMDMSSGTEEDNRTQDKGGEENSLGGMLFGGTPTTTQTEGSADEHGFAFSMTVAEYGRWQDPLHHEGASRSSESYNAAGYDPLSRRTF